MNRRSFLGTLTAAFTGAMLDPERLLWRPGAKMFFLPSFESFEHYHGLITPDWIMQEGLLQLKTGLVFSANVSRSYDTPWRISGAPGRVQVVLRPQRYRGAA